MWSSETKPKIELQLNPKKEPPSDEASKAPPATTNGDHSSSSGTDTTTREKQLSRPKLRSLLAALSFEEQPPPPSSFQRKPKKKKQPMRHKKRLPPPIDTSSHLQVLVHRGTQLVESDGSGSQDVYFDAEEYGDLAKDDFKLKGVARESVVLAGITVTTTTSAHHHHHHRHHPESLSHADVSCGDAVETVLQDGGSCGHHHHEPTTTTPLHNNHSTSSGSSEDVEYSEHEYHEYSHDYEENGHDDEEEEDEQQQQQQRLVAVDSPSNSDSSLEASETQQEQQQVGPPLSPRPPNELPLRFLRAGKNVPAEGLRRYEATLKMRKDDRVDTILREPSPHFALIKQHYPHFCHLTGKNGEPCFYEQPARTNLRALREGGVTLNNLLRHYTMISEYQWQYLERDDLATSIYVIDLDGIRITDFAGEAVDFVKKAAAFSAQHYPERAGYVFVINVPGWFKIIWNVLKPIIDEDTLKKIYILRGKEEIRTAMAERIPLENIPPEYGGNSMPLGESPQEKTLAELIAHNNALAEKGQTVCEHDCKFCQWVPARSY